MSEEVGYTGDVDSNGDRHGQGKNVLKLPIIGLCIYEGAYEHGKKCGYGVEKFGQWDSYEGYWKDDKRHGPGKLSINVDPSLIVNEKISYTYEGDFEEGKYHGKGKLIYREINGDRHSIYEGDFAKGKFNGTGKYTQKGLTYTGLYVDDKRCGQGVLTSEIDGWCLEGIWSDYVEPEKPKEEPSGGGFGFFKKLATEATKLVTPKEVKYLITSFTNNNNNSDVDDWTVIYDKKSHSFSGRTKLSWTDGKVYVGEVENNLPHGQGELTIPTLSSFKGSWIKGKFLGEKSIQDLVNEAKITEEKSEVSLKSLNFNDEERKEESK